MKKLQKISKRINNNLKLLTITLTLVLFNLASCGGDDSVGAATGCNSGNWLTQIEDDTNKFIEASNNYSSNPTKENCEKYKKAGVNYVEAYKNIAKCVPGASKSNYEQALKDLKDEINSINCN